MRSRSFARNSEYFRSGWKQFRIDFKILFLDAADKKLVNMLQRRHDVVIHDVDGQI